MNKTHLENTFHHHEKEEKSECILNTIIEDKFVYESPDKGKTIFKRKPGSLNREQL